MYNFFVVTLPNVNPKENDEANDKVNDEVNDRVNDRVKLKPNAAMILSLIIKDPTITREKLALELGKSISTVDRSIKELKSAGFIAEKSSDKTGEWKILRKI